MLGVLTYCLLDAVSPQKLAVPVRTKYTLYFAPYHLHYN